MQVHQLTPNHKLKTKKRVGRGGKKGTYSGKGGKGQTARAGRKLVPIIRELIKRYPKLRGYRSFNLNENSMVVNLDTLSKHFKDGDVVNMESLFSKGLVNKSASKMPSIKILGRGKIDKKLSFDRLDISKKARQAIEKAGGVVKS